MLPVQVVAAELLSEGAKDIVTYKARPTPCTINSAPGICPVTSTCRCATELAAVVLPRVGTWRLLRVEYNFALAGARGGWRGRVDGVAALPKLRDAAPRAEGHARLYRQVPC